MEPDDLGIVAPAIDLTQVAAIHQKRTLAFLNHFVSHTVRFLNRFSCVCEEKLATLSLRIQKLEITLNLLEAKLASIPGLDQVSAATTTESFQQPVPQPESPPKEQYPAENDEVSSSELEKPAMTVSQDPRYAKFFQMIKVGVPLQALRAKMMAEGLNPDLIETPDAPAPPGGPSRAGRSDEDDDSSSVSSFSD